MERRSSLRRPIHHDATIKLPGGAVWPCIIADYCSEGMLIKYSLSASSAIKAAQTIGDSKSFDLTFTTKKGETFSLSAHPAHMMRDASGIKFDGRYDDVLDALIEDAADSNSVHINREEVEHIIQECIAAIQDYTAPLLQNFYGPLIDEVKQCALKASTDQESNAIMATAEQIEQNQQAIQSAYIDAIHDPASLQQQRQESSEGSLSIIDKGEFEDWLTTRVIITKAETNYREHLLPLKMRLDAIGLADKKHHQSAFGPSLLVVAFHIAVTRLRLSPSLEKTVFSCFEKHIMGDLEALYINLNEILVSHNVMPELDLKNQIKKNTSPPPKKAEPENHEDEKVEGGPANKQERIKSNTQRTSDYYLSELQDETDELDPVLLEPPQFSYGSPYTASSPQSAEEQSISSVAPPFSSPPADSNTPPIDSESNYQNILGMVKTLASRQAQVTGEEATERYSDSELKAGLSELQAQTATETGDLSERVSLLERIAGNLSSSGEVEKAIDEDQKVAIDVVDRFFASLKKNPRLTTGTKEQLFKLEVPVLKVLLEDEGFFDDTNSSVRAVMNRIAQLGAKGSRLSPNAQKRVENLVQQIVQEFEHDTKVFDTALEEFDKLVERQNSLYVKNVERVAAAAEGAHKVELAKVAVAKALNKRLGDRNIPQAVATLVENGWKELLNLTHIRHGDGSDEWVKYLAVIDDLIAYSEDPSQPIQMASLVPTIQEGLKTVSGNEQTSPIVRDHLKQFFEQAPTRQHDVTEPKRSEVPETELSKTQKNLRRSAELKPWIMRAKSIQVGTWVRFNRENEDQQYMRLVWVARGYSKYVFVNHQGMKVVELGLFKLAQYLKDETATPDPYYEMPIVNQGLDDMVKDVYDKLAYESSHDKESGLLNKAEFCRQVRSEMKSGKRTAECSLLYVRYVSKRSVDERPLPLSLVNGASEILKKNRSKDAIVGRLSETDFILFSTGEEADSVIQEVRNNCVAICDNDDESKLFMALTGESKAHLGFNNPESMIEHAITPIEKHQSELAEIAASFEDEFPEDNKELNEAIQKAEEQESAPVIIDTSDGETTPQIPLQEKAFDVFCQKAMMLSNDSVHEEQYELLISEQGTGLSFEPNTEEEAKYLDQWWIDLLMEKHKATDPAWDSIDFMRVKLSGYAFQDELIKEQLLLLADTGEIQPGRVWFDLYFCSVIPNIHAAADMMKQLIAKGYRFCLDQFGTSQSPFPLLKMLPVDLIKIDQIFMEELNEEEASETKADSIVEVAHYLGKEVLASSVDSAICLQRMRQLSVDYVQGSTISEYEALS